MKITDKWTKLLWVAVALPGLVQFLMLVFTVLARWSYPYDLEWMEGGLLTHAARIADGSGIYVEPSVEFIPYLYTPLYPALLALLSSVVELGYQLGRTISFLSLGGLAYLMVHAIVRDSDGLKGPARVGSTLALGYLAATYPWLEGWYDIVRADTLFLVMALGGLIAVRAFAHSGEGLNGHLRIALAAGLLALSFFAKQTGIFFVATGGAMLLILNWRRVPTFVGVAGVIGLGGTWLLNRATDGWYWTYIYEVHQTHDFGMHRVYESFVYILGHYPAMTGVIFLGLLAVSITTIAKRATPRATAALLVWSPIFVVMTVLGAVSWGTQWAHFNAFLPAMITGAMSAGSAIVAVMGCAEMWIDPSKERAINVPVAAGAVLAAALGIQLVAAWWSPAEFIPTAEDRAAGEKLIAAIADIEGDVLVPYHPWYAHLAGKKTFVHRMGVLDVTLGKDKRWPVKGLRESLAERRFSAIILDRASVAFLPSLRRYYRPDDDIPKSMRPRVFTGAGAYATSKGNLLWPTTIWVPNRELEPPPGVTVIENFEKGRFGGWKAQGRAFGKRPETGPIDGQAQVRRFGGRYYATSYHGKDAATGTLTSPSFEISGEKITFFVSGGEDSDKLRVDLKVGGDTVRSATGLTTERMRRVEWSVSDWRGRRATIEVIDNSTAGWGHINVDEFWMWDSADDRR